jgi:hypothetical protein
VPTDLKSGSLKLLEPSGPVQACLGIAVPLSTNGRMHEHVRNERKYYTGINIHVSLINSEYFYPGITLCDALQNGLSINSYGYFFSH